MKQTIYYCDHCGQIINNMTDYVSAKLDVGAVGIDCDLCEECHAKLVENVKKFITKDESKWSVYRNEK